MTTFKPHKQPSPYSGPRYTDRVADGGRDYGGSRGRPSFETVRCDLCQHPSLNRETQAVWRRDYGWLCKNCLADLKKKPCKECFLIHSGECL